MKVIPLTMGKVAIVDDEDFEMLMQWEWQARYDQESHTWYVKGRNPVALGGGMVYMHRLIMGAGKGEQVDHRHHNGLDNRRSELRKCTGSQNTVNKRLQSNNTTGAKGVSFCKIKGKYQAIIKANGKRTFIGFYDSVALAALAYDEAALQYFGEFALTNKMLGLL